MKEEIVNECIRAYFMGVFGRYREQEDPNDMMLRMMSFLWDYLQLSDHADVWDNSGHGLVLMLTKSEGRCEITAEGRNTDWVRTYLPKLFDQFR